MLEQKNTIGYKIINLITFDTVWISKKNTWMSSRSNFDWLWDNVEAKYKQPNSLRWEYLDCFENNISYGVLFDSKIDGVWLIKYVAIKIHSL